MVDPVPFDVHKLLFTSAVDTGAGPTQRTTYTLDGNLTLLFFYERGTISSVQFLDKDTRHSRHLVGPTFPGSLLTPFLEGPGQSVNPSLHLQFTRQRRLSCTVHVYTPSAQRLRPHLPRGTTSARPCPLTLGEQ